MLGFGPGCPEGGIVVITLYLIIAVALIAAGAVAGFVVVVSWGIHREEARYSMTVHPPGRVAAGVRVANGMHARFPGVIQEARYYHRDFRPPGPGATIR